jgi:hypothetical protein
MTTQMEQIGFALVEFATKASMCLRFTVKMGSPPSSSSITSVSSGQQSVMEEDSPILTTCGRSIVLRVVKTLPEVGQPFDNMRLGPVLICKSGFFPFTAGATFMVLSSNSNNRDRPVISQVSISLT